MKRQPAQTTCQAKILILDTTGPRGALGEGHEAAIAPAQLSGVPAIPRIRKPVTRPDGLAAKFFDIYETVDVNGQDEVFVV
jgi:hypothetical protein